MALPNQRGFHSDVHKPKFFKGHSPIGEATTSKPKPIMKGQGQMYIVEKWCLLAHDGRKFSVTLSSETVTIRQTTRTSRSKPRLASSVPQKEAKVYILELGTEVYVKLVEGSRSALTLGRLRVELKYSCSLVTRRKPDTNNGQEDHNVLYRQFRPSSRRHSSEGCSILQARPRQGKPVPDDEMEEALLTLLERPNSQGLLMMLLLVKKLLLGSRRTSCRILSRR